MIQPLSNAPTTWFFKFCEAALAAIALLNLLLFPLEFVPRWFWEKWGQYVEYGLLALPVIALVGGVIYTGVWQRRERTGNGNSGLRHAWLQGIIRYWLAFSISVYGMAKILKTQFQTPNYQLDRPLGDINGISLTWYYFGHSYTLAVIIALFQIGGSVLLLYRRTTLLGVMILLPVMVNIFLINVFFNIGIGPFFNSVLYTLALTFLLLLDVKKLKAMFWDAVDHLPPVTLGRHWVKHALRVLPVATAFALVQYGRSTLKSDPALEGSWKVERLTRNGQLVAPTAWLTDTSAWSRVYFAGWQGCAFSPNPYRYRPSESLRGDYEFDSLKNTLQIVLPRDYDKDTLWATVDRCTTKAMHIRGVFRRDTLDMQLTRLR